MIGRYAVVAGRIHQELGELATVVERVARAIEAAHQRPTDQDLYFDAVALNLHDFYSGLERLFQQIATVVDESMPGGRDWHRELLRQMQVELPQIRPAVLSAATVVQLDEYLRFRHVVRNIYAFALLPNRLTNLAQELTTCFVQVRAELLKFADFLLSELGRGDESGG